MTLELFQNSSRIPIGKLVEKKKPGKLLKSTKSTEITISDITNSI